MIVEDTTSGENLLGKGFLVRLIYLTFKNYGNGSIKET